MSEREPHHEEHTRREGVTALRNAMKLATSLLLTWGVGIVITFQLPNYLGPLRWGFYKYGLEYATALAVFLHFGVDTYISREIPVRPKHTSDFFGGVVVARLLVALPLFAYGWAASRDKLPEERVAALLFGVTQLFLVMNLSFQQILQANSTVGRLAISNVVAKILWGGGIFVAIVVGAPFWVLPLPMLAAEALKALFLTMATRDSVELEWRVDVGATLRVLKVSLPFFIAIAAVYLGASLDVVLLRELVPNSASEEVGWYSAAREIARLSALMMPVLTGVLVPMMSRAMHHDEQEFFRILRRGMEGVCVVSIPLTLMLALGARFAIGLVMKAKFLPASLSLEWLAPTFVLAYVNSLLWLALMIMKRSWTITIISIVGMVLLPAFILLIVPLTHGADGTMGMGVAMALSLRELVIMIVFLAVVGRRALDQRATLAIVKSLGISAVVVGVHSATQSLGDYRLAIDGVLYLVLALATKAIRVDDIVGVLRMIKDRRKIQADAQAVSNA